MTDVASDVQEPRLSFVEPIPTAYSPVLAELAGRGGRKVLVRGSTADVREALEALRPLPFFSDLSLYAALESPGLVQLPGIGEPAPADTVDAVLLFGSDPFEVSHALMSYADLSAGWVCAPATAHSGTNRALFVNSIPKSGTHLLFECARAFGFRSPPSLDLPRAEDEMAPGSFYNLQHMTLDR